MIPSKEMENALFGDNPEINAINVKIENLLCKFGGVPDIIKRRIDNLTSKELSPIEMAIINTKLLRLEMGLSILEKKHKEKIKNIKKLNFCGN